MDLITSKELIIEQVNKILHNYQENENNNFKKCQSLSNDIEITHQMNTKLMKEIEEKDKLLSLSEKKCYDYELMINKIQDDAIKELDEKTKYDMIRAKDKEIFNCENEIKRLQKMVDDLTEKFNEKENNTIKEEDTWKNNPINSIVDDEAKVAVAVQGYMKHTGLKTVTDKEVGQTSIGLDGWYNDTINQSKNKTLVDKMKEVSEEQEDECIHVTSDNFHAIVPEYAKKNNLDLNDSGSIKLAMVKDKYSFQLNVKDQGIYFKELRLNNELENPVVSEVVEEVDEVDEDKGETTEELSDVDEIHDEGKDNKEESTDEEECTVTTIKHYGKEYYIVDGEDPQYIYAIEDGELGDVKGVMKNGKKQMYKK
tara:strand:+ start:1616 stop:2719 length:1104 start_codon:yes stop_codon:yes gene_type:complete